MTGKDINRVGCAVCQAEPGSPCTQAGARRDRPHPARRRLAEQQFGPLEDDRSAGVRALGIYVKMRRGTGHRW